MPLAPGSDLRPVLRGGFDVAGVLSAHLDAVFIRPDAQTTFVYTGMLPSDHIARDLRARVDEAGKAESIRFRRRFNHLSKEAGLKKVRTPTQAKQATVRWCEVKGDPTATFPVVARNADLTLFAGTFSLMDMVFGSLLEATLMRSGTPVLFLPETERPMDWSNPLVAWDGGTACVRAISAWLSIGAPSQDAAILHVSDSGDDLPDLDAIADRLAWHGISASKEVRQRRYSSIGETLLTVAEERNCGVIVMGGYGRFRYSEALFGGVTLHVLRHSSIPVLMMH